jgi:sterol desaturase/sphingolipid hydroxylase (fatty acid hydroxylase superfamily)
MDYTPLREALGTDARPWLAGLLLVLLAAATLEGLVLSWRRPGGYDWRAYFSSLADAVLRRAVDALGLTLVSPLLALAWQHRVTDLSLDNAATVLALFLGLEFSYYGYHRAAHRVRWFWASHAVHHSPAQLSLATAFRLGFTGKLTGTTLFFTPLIYLGFAPQAVFAALALNLLYQFWLHAEWMPRLWAPIEWVFNTPAHHRVHHASNAECLDCNYGGVLIVWDRLFGTFRCLRQGDTLRYGLTTALATYNPVRIALHGWVQLARDLARTQGWRARWHTLWGPPGSPSRSP